MSRLVLRNAAYPPSDPPKRLRASTIGRWFWCAEQVRHLLLGLIPEKEPTEAMETGTAFHKILEESMGRRFPWEERFMDELQKEQDPILGFKLKLYNSTIYHNITGHPDDIQITIDRIVSIVEHKTTKNPSQYMIERYKLPIAKFQCQVYALILEPIVQKLGGVMNRFHAVCYWSSKTFEHIGTYKVPYYPKQVRENVLRVIRSLRKRSEVIAPREWKCKYCSKEHKELCQFDQKT